MARKVFGGDDVSIRGGTRRPWLSAASLTAVVYTDPAGSTLADILTYGGAPIAGSVLTVDADSKLPLFRGPDDDSDTLYVSVNAGPVSVVYARVDDRLDNLAIRSGVETGRSSWDGTHVVVEFGSLYGIDSGGLAYFDDEGVATGDEAALSVDPVSGRFVLTKVDAP